jgi:hypothetical protein
MYCNEIFFFILKALADQKRDSDPYLNVTNLQHLFKPLLQHKSILLWSKLKKIKLGIDQACWDPGPVPQPATMKLPVG